MEEDRAPRRLESFGDGDLVEVREEDGEDEVVLEGEGKRQSTDDGASEGRYLAPVGSVKYYDDEDDGPYVTVEVTKLSGDDSSLGDVEKARPGDHKTRQLYTEKNQHLYDPSAETHYIMVIHGTFDAPPAGFTPTPWYWLDRKRPRNFCGTLATGMEESPVSKEAMWRALPDNPNLPANVPYPFFWSGKNSHDARDKAGRDLAQLINAIGKADPSARVHLVAHSHGGNVTLRAMSHYLTLLRRDANQSYNDKITSQFWEEHAQGYTAIKAWQPPPESISAWTWLLGPLAVVRAPWKEDPSLGPFPYGGWQITDTLLGLPKVRQKKFMRKQWAQCTATNCLGRIVFMGTPFYSKHWLPNAWAGMLINVIVNTLVITGIVTGAAAFCLVLSRASPEFIAEWRMAYWVAAVLGSFLLVMYSTFRAKRFHNGNLYFVEKKGWSAAMQALVLNAGKLDEAALALSTEPLVRAYLMPQLQYFMNPNPWRSFRKFPASNILRTISNGLNNIWVALWNALVAVPYVIIRVLNLFLVPFFSDQLLKLVITLGFGLQRGELEFARVYVEEYLRLTAATQHEITHWNVAKILSGAMHENIAELLHRGLFPYSSLSTEEPMDEDSEKDQLAYSVANRWKFLWDDEALESKAKESPTLELLKDHMSRMHNNPRASRVAFEREIKLICLTLEERYKDMTGNVELSHGGYFRNIAIITAISAFLAKGALPDWAGELGDVLAQEELGPNPRPAHEEEDEEDEEDEDD